jgi:hypothetical protein
MKAISTISSILVLGVIGVLATSWLATEDNIIIDLSDEDYHLYL